MAKIVIEIDDKVLGRIFHRDCIGEEYDCEVTRAIINGTTLNEWIPVSERLPEERKTISGPDTFIDPSEEVLVQMKSGFMKVSRYWGSRERYRNRPWIDLDYPTTDEVIAWMPLPERYKP